MHLAVHTVSVHEDFGLYSFRPWHHAPTSPTTRLGDLVGTLHLAVNVLASTVLDPYHDLSG
jgi:hypothetical protein